MSDRDLSRGKKIPRNQSTLPEWVTGYYYEHGGKSFIREPLSLDSYGEYEIDPATHSRCTGIHDKNDVLIFEGDVLRGKSQGGETMNFVVRYSESHHRILAENPQEIYDILPSLFSGMTLIGNRFDNPELLV